MRSRQKYIFAGILILLVLAFGTSLSFMFPLSTNTVDRVGVSRKSGTPLTSPSEKPVPPSSAAVPPPGTVANPTSEALSLAMPYFFGVGSSWEVHKISSIAYVRTTANDALAVLGPHAQGSENSTAPAWLLVANGIFQSGPRDVCQCTPPIYHDVGLVVVKGQPGVISAESNHSYTLRGLGTVVEVPSSQWSLYGR